MRSWTHWIFTLIVFLVASTSQSYSQSYDGYLNKLIDAKSASNSKLSSGVLLIETNDDVRLQELKDAGIIVKRRVLDNLYIVEGANHEGESDIARNYWPANNYWKLSDQLLFEDKWPQELTVQVVDTDKVTQDWKKIGFNSYLIETSTIVDKEAFLQDKNIQYVGVESNSPATEARVLDMNLNPNRINAVHARYPTLNGQSIVVSVKEQAFNESDVDIVGRTIDSELKSPDLDNHATEMATIIAGAGNSFVTGRGVAKEASLTSSSFENVFPDEDADYQLLNVSVQNHSYGTVIENAYGTKAQGFDLSANNNDKLLHVFSSGNQGAAASETGFYSGIAGYANLTGNFKMAKNVLVVGSVDTVNNVPPFVSVGPAFDGRIKPEVVAYSAVGSSNSAALVSGLTALLQDKYIEQNGVLPSSALLKSILINTADDIASQGPDFKTGYGNVNGLSAVELIASGQHFESTLTDGTSQVFNIDVPANVSILKVTLVWNDPAAELNASKALINDLDLSLVSLGSTFLPWILDTSASSSALSAPAQKGADHLNNIEHITVNNPEPGSYDITVNGFDIPQGPQTFSISYSYELADQFVWTFPSNGDNMPYNGETAGYLRWETDLVGMGKLEYSLDNGVSWLLINNSVNLKKEFYRWNTDGLVGSAMVRMVANNVNYETDAFTLSKTLRSGIGFNCGDSVLLQWSRDPKAVAYDLSFFVQGPALEYFTTTLDTAFIVNNQNGISRYKVKPVYEDGLNGIGTEMFDYGQLNSNCYNNGFVIEVEEGQVKLTSYLTLTYGVKEIRFIRLNEEEPVYISNIAVGSLKEIVAYDENPDEGWNEYKAVIHFDNGETLETASARVYYFDTKLAFVFPNPAEADDFLVVYTKDFGGAAVSFKLISRTGQLVFEQTLYSSSSEVLIPNVEDGLYLYQIETPEGTASGRVIIQQSR